MCPYNTKFLDQKGGNRVANFNVVILNQGLLCESLMYICNVFLQQLTKKKKEGRSRTRPSRATRAGRRARAKST